MDILCWNVFRSFFGNKEKIVPLKPDTITMIMYFIMTFTCSRLLRLWEKKMDGADNFDLATTDTLAYTSGMYRYPDDKKEEQ